MFVNLSEVGMALLTMGCRLGHDWQRDCGVCVGRICFWEAGWPEDLGFLMSWVHKMRA
jgi:hypothetical protein